MYTQEFYRKLLVMNPNENEAVKAITEFRDDLQNVLTKHLTNPKLPVGVIIYKNSDFEKFENLTVEQKQNYFIPLYNGLLWLGMWDHQNIFKTSNGFIPLSKYL